jgi:DNA-binding beta-propeller fold protein YncE
MGLRWGLAVVVCVTMVSGVWAQNGKENGVLVVVEKGAMSLGIVDPVSGRLVASVPEGGKTGHEVAVSPDGRFAYVPIYGDSGVGKPGTDGQRLVVIDVAAHAVVGSLDFGRGVRPHLPVWGKDGMLYVTTELEHSVTVVDVGADFKTLTIVGEIPTGQAESHMLALSHDGRLGYTANVGPGTVSVLDLKARKTLAVIPVGGTTQRIAVSMDDKWVFTADQTKPELVVIDAAARKVARRVALPGLGYGGAVTPDGRWFLIAVPMEKVVAVVDLGTMAVVKTIAVPALPQAVLVRPDGKVAYVSCDESGAVAEIEVAGWNVGRVIQVGKLADGMAWAGR